ASAGLNRCIFATPEILQGGMTKKHKSQAPDLRYY
ncbi:MAG: hypothetical protein RIQ75_47, partial [Pseudomonadota bacterium]